MDTFLVLDPIVPIFFVYGLAFYTMGVAIALESGGHIADRAVREAMRALAIFALVHGLHEWFEMFLKIVESFGFHASFAVEIGRVVVLIFSFGALCVFGLQMLALHSRRFSTRRAILFMALLFSVGVWGIVHNLGPEWDRTIHAVDSWARYSLGVTGGALAGAGLLVRARDCRQQGMPAVARGWLIAGGALAVYGLVGQSAPSPSAIFPAVVYNAEVFQRLFGFPVQLLRAAAAAVSTVGLLGALRALELQRQRALQAANEARLEAQARAQEEMARREALQRELLRRTVAAQEQERSRIARELHDEIGQTLTALHFSVAALRSSLESGKLPSTETVDALHNLTNQALTDLRQLVTDLRPAQLDDLGLVAAVHWLGDHVRTRLNLNVEVEIHGRKLRLPPDVETALFRVTQEALTNVAKHAGVRSARVLLAFEKEAVVLEVSDQGEGFDVERVLASSGSGSGAWGIAGMQERLSAVEGRLKLISAPGQGTVVRAMIPLLAEKEDVGKQTHTVDSGR